MKNITIKANDFFELLKLKDQSMWDIFAQMIDGEEKEIVFLNDDKEYIFHYILPTTIEKLQEDLFEIQKRNDKIDKEYKITLEEMELLRRELASALLDRDRTLKTLSELREKYGENITTTTTNHHHHHHSQS